jgi:BolA protein
MDTSDALDTRTHIEQRLRDAFAPVVELDVIDQSAAHAGHAGAREGGGHFHVILVAEAFEGTSPIQRQRDVYKVLAEEMKSRIHALSMSCLSPSEYEAD